MSRPFDDYDEELEVALEVSKVDDFDGNLTKALRLSKIEAREREEQEAKRKRALEQSRVAAAAGHVVDAA
jgi:hypothetical protein